MATMTTSPTSAVAAPATTQRRKTPGQWVVLGVTVVFGVLMLAPFLIMLLNAFKSPADYSANGPLSLPESLYFDGLGTFWERVGFETKLWNSIWTSALVAGFAVIVSLLNAYALGVGRVKGRLWIVALFLLANMLPQEMPVYPLFTMMQNCSRRRPSTARDAGGRCGASSTRWCAPR